MKLHPDAPEMTWQEARVIVGIVESMGAMARAAKESADRAAEESGAIVERNGDRHLMRAHLYRRCDGPSRVRTCWLIEHGPDAWEAKMLHDRLVCRHAHQLSISDVRALCRSRGAAVRAHRRVRRDALVLRLPD